MSSELFTATMRHRPGCREKCSGIPVKMWRDGSWVRISEYFGFERFHHYCRGSVASQYCSFTQKGNRWIATHLDAQHQTFTNLINALEATIDDHYANTWLPGRGEKEPVNIQFHYPLLVIQGDLYLAREKRGGLVMQKVRHVQFRREVWSAERRDAYQIDVIQESFIGSYPKSIDKELESIKKRFVRRRADVRDSIAKLIALARQERKRRTPFRRIYEPSSRF